MSDLSDVFATPEVLERDLVHKGLIFDLVREKVDLGGERGVHTREFIDHPGAVTVLALDDQDRVLMIQQYRHPVRMELWELPAGLLDVAGEPPLEAAKRELLEEADLTASRWDVLVDWFNTPGGSNEALRLYLARDVSLVPEDLRHQREAEELGMPTRWIPLDEAVAAVLSGRVHNPGSVIGVLAGFAARASGWATLRAADVPWPEHPLNR